MTDQPLVSVLVLTRDRPEMVARCLRSLTLSDYSRVEVLVYDNGSERAGAALADEIAGLGERPSVRLVRARPAGFAEMRRRAVALSRGEIVMSLDDDCLAAPDAVGRVVRRFAEEPDVGIVGGRIVNVGFEGADRLKGRGRIGRNGRYEPVEDPAKAEVFGSANMSFRRRAYDEAGGYDPFFRDGLEEADLTLAVRERGWRVVYEPAVEITHHHCPQRFRERWSNLDLMRLYLLFKHRPPADTAGWRAFVVDERAILTEQWRALRRRSAERRAAAVRPAAVLRATALGGFEALKLLLARAAVPWLWLRARRVREGLG